MCLYFPQNELNLQIFDVMLVCLNCVIWDPASSLTAVPSLALPVHHLRWLDFSPSLPFPSPVGFLCFPQLALAFPAPSLLDSNLCEVVSESGEYRLGQLCRELADSVVCWMWQLLGSWLLLKQAGVLSSQHISLLSLLEFDAFSMCCSWLGELKVIKPRQLGVWTEYFPPQCWKGEQNPRDKPASSEAPLLLGDTRLHPWEAHLCWMLTWSLHVLSPSPP